MFDYNLQTIPSEKIKKYSQYVVKEFEKKTADYPSHAIDLVFYPTRSAYSEVPIRAIHSPIFAERLGNHFTIHLCEESLKNIPSMALQGWMEHEMMLCVQKLQPEFYGFNFRKSIFPLMPVTGLAENHMRELVASIEAGLGKYLATKTLIDMGIGLHQVHFHFYGISPVISAREDYESVRNHLWTKALHLCRKLRELMPISKLSEIDIGFSRDLETCWWKAHDYLQPEDRRFLKEMTSIPHRFSGEPYSQKLVEIFKTVKSQYLLPRTFSVPSPASSTLH